MPKIAKISILLSFLGLWVTSFLKNESQIIVGFVLIFLFGISHGANDLLIISKISQKNPKSYWQILAVYVSVIILVIVMFNYSPWLVLILFILVSSYHFGEQHWENKASIQDKSIGIFFKTTYGLCILLLLLCLHNQEVVEIIYNITGVLVKRSVLTIGLIISVTLQIGFALYIYMSDRKIINHLSIELVYLAIFATIFKVGSLIWGFTVYFIFWHSIPSLIDQIKFIYGDTSSKNIVAFCKSAFLYWIISIIGLATFYMYFKEYKMFDSIFFTFLAAITFPHAIVIERMYFKINKKTE